MQVPPTITPETAFRLCQSIAPLLADATRADLKADEVLRVVCEHAQALTRASGAVIEMAEDGEMVYAAASGSLVPFVGMRIAQAGSLSGLTMSAGEVSISADTETDPRVHRAACRKIGARSMVLVPLSYGGRGAGVLKVVSPEPDRFHADDIAALAMLANVIGVIILRTRDIAARDEMRRSLDLSRRMASLGHLSTAIAHQFNNVLMGIQSTIEVIARSEPHLAESVRVVQDAVGRGKHISDQAMAFARARREQQGQVPIGGFFRRLRPEIASVAGLQTSIAFEIDEDASVAIDERQLSQVVMNLVVNAFDAMPGGGALTIRAHRETARPDAGLVRISVSDTGIGIDDDARPHVFEPMFTTKLHRSGLGLSLVYRIVEAHGGSIDITSRVGEGTTVDLLLPSSRQNSSAPTASVSPVRSVLLVEDDTTVADGLKVLLELEGISCEHAPTGEEAIRLLEQSTPDAVILDVALPGISGMEAFRQIRAKSPVPVIFSTGHGDEQSLAEYLAQPRVALLRKPYQFDDLLRELQAV